MRSNSSYNSTVSDSGGSTDKLWGKYSHQRPSEEGAQERQVENKITIRKDNK